MKKNTLLFILLYFTMIFTLGAFEFSPIGFDKRIDNGEGYGEFFLDNSTGETQRYKVKILGNGKKNDISKYVKIYPTIVTVKPKDRGVIKVYVEAPKNLKNGVYGFMIGCESIAIPTLKKDGKDVDGAVSMRTNVAVEMEAYVGSMEDKIEVKRSKIIEKNGERYFQGEFFNGGERGYEIGVGFVDGDNSLIEVYSQGRMGASGRMKVEVKIPPRSKKLIFYDYNNQVFLKKFLML